MADKDASEDKERQGAAPETQAALPRPPALAGGGIEEGRDGGDHGNERHTKFRWLPRGIKPAEWIMILFTAVTALAAWAGVAVNKGQLDALRVQVAGSNETSRQTERQLALQAEANAAIGFQGAKTDLLARTAHDQEIVENRAWLAPVSISLKPFGADKYTVLALFTNTGHAPAFNVEDAIEAVPLLTLDRMNYRFQDGNIYVTRPPLCGTKPKMQNLGVMFPGTGGNQIFNQKVKRADLIGDLDIVVRICVKYQTLGVQAQTEVCELAIALNDAGQQVPLETAQFRMCSNQNQAK